MEHPYQHIIALSLMALKMDPEQANHHWYIKVDCWDRAIDIGYEASVMASHAA